MRQAPILSSKNLEEEMKYQCFEGYTFMMQTDFRDENLSFTLKKNSFFLRVRNGGLEGRKTPRKL